VRRILLASLFTLVVLMPSRPVSAQGVLPPAFGNWTIGQTSNAQPITLQQAAGNDAAILNEYGFETLEHRDYIRGNNTLSITLFRMVDPTAAYGAFTYLRPANMPDSKLAQYSAVSQNRALIVDGNFLLDVTGERIPASTDDLASLVTVITPKADHRPFPSIADHLPSEGLVPHSERYVLGPIALQKLLPVADGDWVGFSQGAEAILARYRKGAQEVTLLVAEYPTQQLAAARFEKMTPVLASLSSDRPSPEHPAVSSRREAGLIILAFDPHSGEYGKALLSQVIFGHNIIWNEPKFTVTEPSINVYIVGAFVGTGAICLIAIVSGLGFAALRLVVKFFFPGKVFDRPRSIEIIQLDLNGRSVNTKDFY
jgi:hypothetical protein